mgnify:CR=1 FL=1
MDLWVRWRSLPGRSASITTGQLVPALVVGLALAPLLWDRAEVLPGVWTMLFGVGMLSTAPYLPGPIRLLGIFYLVAGGVIAHASMAGLSSPWPMGLTFGAGGDGSGGMLIWPLFGTTNQLLAGLTLLVVTVMLMRNHRPVYYTLIPLVFLLIVTVLALLAQLKSFFVAGNYFLLALDIVVLIASVLVAMECASALKRLRHEVRGEAP